MNFEHIPVLLNECIKPNGIYVDGTLGGGGHSSHIASLIGAEGTLVGIDRDADAIEAASQRLKDYTNVKYVKDNFSNIKNIAHELGIEKFDGFLLDLGVSSHQLNEADRGMVVNEYTQAELTRIIKDYGEERWAKRIAEFIINERKVKPVETTFELVSIIKKAIPKGARSDGPHPAKRTFQAIRIEVNNELGILEDTVRDMTDLLKPGGRICIITFHSLEDRIIKNVFRELEDPCTCPRDFPVCVCGKKPQLKVITRKPILPSKEETEENRRAHSAKLRIAEKL